MRHPEGWTISSAGNYIAGNVSAADGCRTIAITWMRDSGPKPNEILNQIAETYNQGEMRVLSKSQDEVSIQGRMVEVLNISYKFKERGNVA